MKADKANAPAKRGWKARLRAALWRWTKRVVVTGVVLVVLGAAALALAIRHYESELPSIPDLKSTYHPPQVTRILAKDGTTLAEVFTERRTVVAIGTLPAHVKLAVLAAEDANFYEHEGVNYLGIVRAIVVNIRAGRTKQGGSTITQQVVKNILLDSEKSYRRKIREALLARRLEQELSKDEILELYLNHIYFGHARWGIEEIARYHFGKAAKDLTIAEAALLAGVVANPENYSPRKDAKKALTRRAYVLGQMRAKGFLDDVKYQAASEEPVRLAPTSEVSSELAPEVVEIARKMLHELEPERARLGGFTVTTSIDPKLQQLARKTLRENLAAYDKRHGLLGPLRVPAARAADDGKKKRAPPPEPIPLFDGTPSFEHHKVYGGVVTATDDALGTFDVRVGSVVGVVKLADYERYNPGKLAPSAFAPAGARLRVSLLASPDTGDGRKVPLRLEGGPEGALVAIDARSRQILALVGSYEGAAGLDRATQARRQPGSTFKPIVYSYAIQSRRFTPATLIDLNPDGFDAAAHNNEGATGRDPIRLREALAGSVNLAAVRVLRDAGPAHVVEWGHALGIKSTLKPDLSLALGSYEVYPIELAAAYATFAAGGVYDEPRVILKIVGPDGKEVPLKDPPPPRRVMGEPEAFVTTSLLASVIDHGTARAAASLRRPLAGKTGTTNIPRSRETRDAWFAGFSPDVVAVTWIGYDDGRALGVTESGASTALPGWIAFMRGALDGRPRTEFVRPPGVTTMAIDKRTGKLPYTDDPEVMDEVFLAGTEPNEIADAPEPATPDAGAPREEDSGAADAGASADGSAPEPRGVGDAGLSMRREVRP